MGPHQIYNTSMRHAYNDELLDDIKPGGLANLLICFRGITTKLWTPNYFLEPGITWKAVPGTVLTADVFTWDKPDLDPRLETRQKTMNIYAEPSSLTHPWYFPWDELTML